MGKKHFCFFQTAETGNRTPNSGVKGSGANHYHYPRAPALDHLTFFVSEFHYNHRPFDMIVMKFRDEVIIIGLGLIIVGDIFFIYYMLNRLTFKV